MEPIKSPTLARDTAEASLTLADTSDKSINTDTVATPALVKILDKEVSNDTSIPASPPDPTSS